MADALLVEAAKRYNVPLGLLEGIAAAEGQSWDLVHPGGEIGRFGLHPVHAAEIQKQFGISFQELANRPDAQIAFWVPRIAAAWNNAKAAGASDEKAAWAVVDQVQAPKQEYRAREVQSILQHLGQETVSAAGTRGGVMPEPTTQGIWEQQAAAEFDSAQARSEKSGHPISAILAADGFPTVSDRATYIQVRSTQLAQEYSTQAEPPESLEAPSPQEVAVGQFDMERILAEADARIQEIGLSAASEEFRNKVTALQEGRTTAEYAQEYAGKIAPPGMTTVPFTGPTSAVGQLQQQIGMTPSPAIPLRQAPVTDPYQALQQAQQFGPQAPSLQFQAPALPQAPQLSQLDPFPQVVPNPMMGGAASPMGNAASQMAGFSGADLPMATGAADQNFADALRKALQMLSGVLGGPFPSMSLPTQ